MDNPLPDDISDLARQLRATFGPGVRLKWVQLEDGRELGKRPEWFTGEVADD